MENYKHRMDIEELIERGETQSVEFKESLKLKEEIGETVSAFSNSDGGTVIVGVSDSSSELGKLAKESGERVYWDERVCEDASLELRNLVRNGLLGVEGRGRSTTYIRI